MTSVLTYFPFNDPAEVEFRQPALSEFAIETQSELFFCTSL